MNPSMKKEKVAVLTIIGIVAMILLISTQALPSFRLVQYSMVVGLASFFIVEAAAKTPDSESGLRFKTIPADLKKPGVLFWTLLPIVTSIGSILLGKLIFENRYVDHVLGRTGSILSFDNAPLLMGELILAAFGEEIAFRGFFVGKGMRLFPYWLCALVSSAAFAAAHIAAGDTGVVIYDVAGIFIDALIYATVYRKSGNCVISTFAHFLCNAVGLLVVFAFFR